MNKVYCKKCQYAEYLKSDSYDGGYTGRCLKNPHIRSTPMEETILPFRCADKNKNNDCKDYESKT